MIEKVIDYWDKYSPRLRDLQDVRVIGLLLFGIAVLLVTWSGIKTIDTNYRLQKQISELDQQNDVQALANKNLRLQNEYYQTDQYLELSARQNFGLAKAGETELIVPKDVALSYTIEPITNTDRQTAATSQPAWQRNFQAWVDFFLHR